MPRAGRAVALDAPPRTEVVLDPSRPFRYWWSRTWDARLPTVNFVLLNPSTADQHRDDPTVRRVVAFAKSWGFGAVVVTNLFALRATHPRTLYEVPDPVGPENDRHLVAAAASTQLSVAGWGIHGALLSRHEAVLALLAGVDLTALGVTQAGFPRHPLYLNREARPVRYLPVPADGCALVPATGPVIRA